MPLQIFSQTKIETRHKRRNTREAVAGPVVAPTFNFNTGKQGSEWPFSILERKSTLTPVLQTNLVTAVKQLNTRIGPSFYLSMAPEHPYVQGGFSAYSGIWGAYLPIIDGLRQELDLIHVQYYNNGALYTPYSQNGLAEGSVDMLVGASLMLIEGFRTNNGTGVAFNGLRPDQVAFGLPSGPSSANSGLASQATITSALNCLTRLQNCGTIRPQQAYPTFRGVMTWSVNWDRRDGFIFSRPVRATLNTLP